MKLNQLVITLILINLAAVIWLLLTQTLSYAEIVWVIVLSTVNLISLSKLIK